MVSDLKEFVRRRCYDFGALYSLEDELNKVGLTVQPTCGGDMVLCKLVEGRPLAKALGVDHLFVGVQSRPRDQIPHKLLKCILEFLDVAAGGPDRLVPIDNPPRTGHSGLYGDVLEIGPVMQDLALDRASIEDDLLYAIKEWCDGQV